MTVKELHIGGFYRLDEREGRLLKWLSSKKVEIKMEHSRVMVDADFLDPIPLTEEWLERFGFEMEYLGWERQRPLEDVIDRMVEFPTGGYVFYTGFKHFYEIAVVKYVHQLQNLYYALTGEELEIIKP